MSCHANDDAPLDAVLTVLDSLLDSSVDESAVLAPLAGAVDGDGLAQVTRRVRQVRSALARWQRRDRELSVLFSSARELAELRDVDALLDRLVARARELVGTDVTYLSEFHQDTDELRVRSTSGAVTRSFRQLRVPPGMGLASKVVRTRSPQWTPSYDGYADAPHEAGIDAAVHDEGLVSLLGVPMAAGDRLLGVLFAANRSEHAFSPEEIALLSAFADHAAVVLQTTWLLAQAQESADAAREANAGLAATMAAMERANVVHQNLTDAVLRGGTAQEVAGALSSALGRFVEILDRELSPLAAATDGEPATSGRTLVTPELAAVVERSRSTGRCVFPDGADGTGGPAVVVAVVAGETMLGAVLVDHGELAVGAVEQRTIERAAQIVALLALKQQAVADVEERVSGELIGDILRAGHRGDDASREDLVVRARVRGARLEALRTVTAVMVPRDRRRRAVQATPTWDPGVLIGEHGGCVVVLADADDPGKAAGTAREHFRAAVGGPVLAVSGGPVESWTELGARFALVRRCAELLGNLGVVDDAVDAAAYEPYVALFGTRRDEVVRFTEAVLGPLLRWDRARGTDLVGTLRCFVDAQASPAHTARALNVHINTVTQRLDRVGALLGERWREPESFFRLTVAVRMQALMSSTHG